MVAPVRQPLQIPLNYRYPVRLFAGVLRLVTRSQRFDFSGGRRCRPDSPGKPGQRGELQPSRFPLGETCLQLSAANYGQPGRRSGLDAGRILESLPESPQARRSRTLRPLAVPHRAQRGLQHVPQAEARDRCGRNRARSHGDQNHRGRKLGLPHRTVAGRRQRFGPPLDGPARSGGAENLPGFQVRGNGGDSLLPGFHHQVPPLHRARTAQNRAGSHEGKGFVMSCSPFDLKDYFLQELPSTQRVQVEAHVKSCLTCREELERLQLTGAALFSLRDEEIPQRIAFLSDQVFEPSPLRRWLSGFWCSTARLGFASALVLSASIFFAAIRPGPIVDRPAARTVAAVSPSPQEIQQQIRQAVSQAVAEVEARQEENNRQLVAEFSQRSDAELRSVRWMVGELDANRKRNQVTRAMLMVQPTEGGEIK